MGHAKPVEPPDVTATQLMNNRIFQAVATALLATLVAFGGYYVDAINTSLAEIKDSIKPLNELSARVNQHDVRDAKQDAKLDLYEQTLKDHAEALKEHRAAINEWRAKRR